MNGYIKINIGGKDRGFKFGLYVLSEVLKALKIGINDIDTALSNNPIEAIAVLMYNAGAYNCAKTGEVVDFTVMDVYDWLDEAGGLGSPPVQAFNDAIISSLNKDVPAAKLSDEKKSPSK